MELDLIRGLMRQSEGFILLRREDFGVQFLIHSNHIGAWSLHHRQFSRGNFAQVDGLVLSQTDVVSLFQDGLVLGLGQGEGIRGGVWSYIAYVNTHTYT